MLSRKTTQKTETDVVNDTLTVVSINDDNTSVTTTSSNRTMLSAFRSASPKPKALEPEDILDILDEAIAYRRQHCHIPEFTPENLTSFSALISSAITAVKGFASGGGSDQDIDNSAEIALATLTGINLASSAAAQIKAYITRIMKLQLAQIAAIKAVIHLIKECKCDDNGKIIEIKAPYTADKVIKAMETYGNISIVLNIPDTNFSFEHPSVKSFKTAKMITFSLIPTAVSIATSAVQLTHTANIQQNVAGQMTVSAVTGTPFGKIYAYFQRMTELEIHLLQTYRLIFENYFIAFDDVDAVKEYVIAPLTPYVPPAKMTTIRETVEAVRALKDDPEAGGRELPKDLEHSVERLRLTGSKNKPS